MGTVLFSSGRPLSATGYILDTAFVKVPEADSAMWNHGLNSNKLPKYTAAGLHKRLPRDYRHGTDGKEDTHLELSAISYVVDPFYAYSLYKPKVSKPIVIVPMAFTLSHGYARSLHENQLGKRTSLAR